MQKNKFTTYLLYAIGEIVLVVIGILIAVSINNWNTERKEVSLQQKYYEDILIDLRKDSTHFQGNISFLEKNIFEYYKINAVINSKFDTATSPFYDRMMYQFFFSPVTQQNHQGIIEKLTNTEIRKLLNDYFLTVSGTETAIASYNRTAIGESRPFFARARQRNIVFHTDTLGFLPKESMYDSRKMHALLQEEQASIILEELRLATGYSLSKLNELMNVNNELMTIIQNHSR